MKHLIVATAVLLTVCAGSRAASACFPCSYWSTWGDREHVCAVPSEGLLDADIACLRGTCAGPCASWLASYDACASSGTPTCTPSGTSDCYDCMEGNGAYVGLGCAATTSACSADQTGCTSSCAAWIGGAAICDVVTQEEDALEACACAGACASKCGSMCIQSAYGGLYYDNGQPMTQQCAMCMAAKHGCQAEYLACMGA